MSDLNNTFNIPTPGSPRFESDTIRAMGKIRDALGVGSDPSFGTIELMDATVSRLVATDADGKLASTDLFAWAAGTANQITVTDDTDGTITLSTPQDLDTSADFTVRTLDISLADHADAIGMLMIENTSSTAARYPGFTIYNYRGATGGHPFCGQYGSAGTKASPAIMPASDILGAYIFGGYNGTAFVETARIAGYTEATFDATHRDTDLRFYTGLDTSTNLGLIITSASRVGVGTAAPSLKFDVKGAPNTSFTNCPLLAQVHTTDAYADGMGGGISLGGMYDATHSTTFGYIAGVKDGATISDTAGKLILGARATGGGAPDMAVVTIHGTGVTEIGDGGTTNYAAISGTGDLSFAGSAGFYPRRITQSAEPANGTGATQIDVGELVVWRDPDDNKTYMVYQDTDEGVRKVEMT